LGRLPPELRTALAGRARPAAPQLQNRLTAPGPGVLVATRHLADTICTSADHA
jgi:hypothetical protein